MKKLLAVLMFGLLVIGCGGEKEQESGVKDDGRLTVAAVNYPLAYFAERIGGGLVEVVYPVPADVDPAFWNPSPEGVAAFQSADLVLLNGATYAKWVPKVTLAPGKLVDTSAAFADRYIEIADAVTHTHGPGGDHAHTGTAFTTWLDFSQAALQAEAIRGALAKRDPANEEAFAANFAALEKDLADLDIRMRKMTADKIYRPLVASHPVYQYLARRYNLALEAVMWEPEVVPPASSWRDLAAGLEAHPAQWMIWEGEPAVESASRLKEMGVQSLVFAPCMNAPESGDFLSIMRSNVAALAEAFR